MPILYIFIFLIIIMTLISLLFNPYVWLIVIALSLYSWFKRYLFIKSVENKEKEFYNQSNDRRKSNASNDDIIDVAYREVDDK